MPTLYIFCVSLVGSEVRRSKINLILDANKKLLEELNIEFKYFDATYGRDISSENRLLIEALLEKSKFSFRALGSGELGCLLSHLRLWAHISGNYNDGDRFIIIEDDVEIIDTDLESKLRFILKRKPNFLFLAAFPVSNNKKILAIKNGLQVSMYGPRYLYTRTCAYLCSKKMAHELISRTMAAPFVVDNWEWLLVRDRCSLVEIFKHSDFLESTIAPERLLTINERAKFFVRYKRRIIKMAYKIIIFVRNKKISFLDEFLVAP